MLHLVVIARKSVHVMLLLTLLTFSGVASSNDASVTLAAQSLTFKSTNTAVKYLAVTVVDSAGSTVFSQTGTSQVSWNLSDSTTDGRYKYEIKLSNIAAGSRDRSTASSISAVVSTQSGSVMVVDGSIVLPASEEVGSEIQSDNFLTTALVAVVDLFIPVAHADQQILDDLIIDGSTCIGLDCINGEAFGFDTLRLKENNLRIHFNDTSNSASFPSSDWRIVINETSNGGANFFGIEDATAGAQSFTLEAGAPANSIYIDSNGRLGFGTSTPSTSIESVSGNSPTLRLNQDGSEGFQAQSWDVGGNETGFFVRDFSNGETLPFRIASSAPTDSLAIGATGNIGLGIDAPTEKLHVMGNAIISGNLELGSSRAIKHAIESLDLPQAMAALLNLEPVKYRYNHSPEQQTLGFIAEDVPDLLATESRKSLKPMDIVAVLTKVVQAQQQTIDELSVKIDGLLEDQAAK